MIIECTSCGSKYKYDESKLSGSSSKKVKCPKCKGVIDVRSPDAPPEDKPLDPTRLEQTFSSMESPSYETQPSPKVRSAMDSTSASSAAPDSPKTTKVKRDTLMGGEPANAVPDSLLKMPDNLKISLALISGAHSGEIYQINRPRMVIGRGDAEIPIQDPEASRSHARIDVMGDRIILRDLNSTNGTFVDEQKIASTTLENHSEFRIGTTVFMLIITEVE